MESEWAAMRLTGFRVTNFRSVEDSGWLTLLHVAALIGVNESGKTNLLLPLWKLNPAREGAIQPTSDYPKKLFGTIRANPGAYCFITAEFDAGDLADQLAALTDLTREQVRCVQVHRFFDGHQEVAFPSVPRDDAVSADTIGKILKEAGAELETMSALTREGSLKEALLTSLSTAVSGLPSEGLSSGQLNELAAALRSTIPADPAKTSTIVPRYTQALEAIEQHVERLSSPAWGEVPSVRELVLQEIPKFVYYSNYGNLDSEIYLPHVVENLRRTDLGAKEADKARTLRVLFRFVQLSPTEILELGRDFRDPQHRRPTDQEIAAIAEHKRERSILLQSAGVKLTESFKNWWKQGDYRFRFEADGDHFRIWVSDDRRPAEVELESRSSGLQWFLSFYLVFLVESEEEHRNAILLLDEPGLSLHPLAQRDLSEFFEGLATTNQILYTTHSPFLVDADHLDRARKVYVASDGTTKATEDLRQGTPEQAGAAYAVYSALGLSIAESLLLGCKPVIVEGPSDQHYLTAIKALLIGAGKIAPTRELVFPPSGGTRTARIAASILTGRDESLPIMLLDDDHPGRQMAAELKKGLYAEAPERVLNVASFTDMPGSEIEDLFPGKFIAEVIDRWQREPEEQFAGVLVATTQPIVGQIEAWAGKNGVVLDKGWKVELAKRVKRAALERGFGIFEDSITEKWCRLFEAIQ